MARIYPNFLLRTAQKGEKQVYRQLKDMPDDWVVFHNVWEHYKSQQQYINYEADFIVLIPHLGIAVIEVKDWPHVRLKDGIWQSKGDRENDEWVSFKGKKTPLNQAFLNAKKLTSSLVKRGIIDTDSRKQPEIRSLAILTNSIPENMDESDTDASICRKCRQPLNSLYLCGREALENELQHRLKSLFVHKRTKGEILNRDMIKDIENYLTPSMYFRLDFSNYTETMENAAPDLLHLLPRLEESTGGIRIDGCAGTGKTEMALREIRRLAAEYRKGRSILLLCYNNNLVYRLKRALKGCKGKEAITVSGFHDYCIGQLVLPSGKAELIRYDKHTPYLDDDGWSWVEREAKHLPRYDYIFVDEAQDFKIGWWNIIRTLLSEQGKLYIFADTNQDLYDRSHGLPELPTRIRLTRNLRNAWKIADFSAAILPGIRMDYLPFIGSPLKIGKASDSPEERAAEVMSVIMALRNNRQYGVCNSDIVVLSPWRAENERCCLKYCRELDFAHGTENAEEAADRHERCRRRDSPRILADTIKGFKGLEAPFVILTDICAAGEYRGFRKRDFYVACTRARFGLYIIPTVSGEKMVKNLLNC